MPRIVLATSGSRFVPLTVAPRILMKIARKPAHHYTFFCRVCRVDAYPSNEESNWNGVIVEGIVQVLKALDNNKVLDGLCRVITGPKYMLKKMMQFLGVD